MQKVLQEFSFTSVVSESLDVNEFVVEFTPKGEPTEQSPIKVTRNFDELIAFLDEMEE